MCAAEAQAPAVEQQVRARRPSSAVPRSGSSGARACSQGSRRPRSAVAGSRGAAVRAVKSEGAAPVRATSEGGGATAPATAPAPRAWHGFDGRDNRPPAWERPGSAPHARCPRAMRPCSASSVRTAGTGTATSGGGSARGAIGTTPWVISIDGGPHDYSNVGGVHLQPPLATSLQVRGAAGVFAIPAESGQTYGLSPLDLAVLTPQAVHEATAAGERKLQVCPTMRAKGTCRLPNCPYIHEVCVLNKKYRGHKPLYNSHLPKDSKAVPCRFLLAQGSCPHGDSCIFSHDAVANRGAGPIPTEGSEDRAIYGQSTSRSSAARSGSGAPGTPKAPTPAGSTGSVRRPPYLPGQGPGQNPAVAKTQPGRPGMRRRGQTLVWSAE